MSTKHRLALTLTLSWSGCSCVLQQQRCFHPAVHPWYTSVPRREEPSGACSCRPSHDISVCYSAFFCLCPRWAPSHCRAPQMGGAGCGTLSLCKETTQVPPDFILMQPSSLPWWNGARLFLWSVRQLLDLPEELSHLKAISDWCTVCEKLTCKALWDEIFPVWLLAGWREA